MLSSFGMDFALKFGGDDQKNKKIKVFIAKSQATWSRSLDCCFIEKKRLWWPISGQKFAGPLVLVLKFTLTWEAQAVIWRRTAQPPRAQA